MNNQFIEQLTKMNKMIIEELARINARLDNLERVSPKEKVKVQEKASIQISDEARFNMARAHWVFCKTIKEISIEYNVPEHRVSYAVYQWWDNVSLKILNNEITKREFIKRVKTYPRALDTLLAFRSAGF